MNTETLSAPTVPTKVGGRMPVEQAKAIEVTRVRKTYGLRPILRDISFEVAAGQRMAVLGPNGAGKTTLLRILATLTRPAQGSVSIAGYDAFHEAHTVRRLVGYVGHAPLLYDELTARENLLFFARMYGLPEAESRVDAMLARVGMRSRANDRVGTFSRGQAQRVALARGILHDPQVLLLDEPDTGLDEDAITLLHELIAERKSAGLTTLLTTHTLERGLLWSDMVVVLTNGRISHTCASAEVTLSELRALYTGAGRSDR
ncbi:MAG TPA: heme ABC exporter ATP-binding protein CcmA [Ktedonobacterales bacterium]|nr:heme ABC exporter ATP-binding protein CcmA [Ktedonobacterales bacterium]